MRHLLHMAWRAGFLLEMEGPRAVLRLSKTPWRRTFHAEESLRAFLAAALRGQALQSRDYRTTFDANPAMHGYLRAQYRKGYRMARRGAVIYIGASGAWSADVPSVLGPASTTPTYGYMAAYEVLGGACGTAELLQGWRDGGAVIIDYRPATQRRRSA